MIRKFAVACALATAALALPADAATLQLGMLDCSIGGGQAMIVTSNKDLACTFRPSSGGPAEAYSGVVSKLGVDVGTTHEGRLSWAVLAASRDYDQGALAGKYYGVNAEASVGAGGGANILVGGFQDSVTLQPVSVQAQTGLNLAVAVTSLELVRSFK